MYGGREQSMGWLELVWRTITLYGVILVIFRLMGKREIGELSVLDLVVFIMLGEIAVAAIEDKDKTVLDQVVPMVTLMVIQVTLAFISIKSRRIRRVLDGEPVILIRDGKVDERQMRKQRYSFDDLLLQLRDKSIGDLRDVAYAILEPSGRLSIFPKQHETHGGPMVAAFTFPLIIDGVVQDNHLQQMNKTDRWLRQKLRELGYHDITKISYCSFQNGQFFVDLIDT